MADLTGQDINNYDKLKEALNNLTTTNDTITKIKARIPKTGTVKNTEDLSSIVNPLYSYWKVLSDLETPLKFTDSDKESKKFEQQFSDAIEDLKDSLQLVEAEKLDLTDGLDKLRPDSLFLSFVPGEDANNPNNPKKLTQKLIDNIDLNLKEEDTIKLIEGWRTAVNLFTEDAHKRNEKKAGGTAGEVTPFKADTFAHFFRIHKELEILYSRLAETETFQESR